MRLPDTWKDCPECGQPLDDPMEFFCEDCQKELEEDVEEDYE